MLQPNTDSDDMTRALLTNGERQAIRGDQDLDASTTSSHLSRVRNKMDAMATDARLLREHHPELYERLHEAVCDEDIDERIERLEQEVEVLRSKLDEEMIE